MSEEERDDERIKQLEFLKVQAVVSSMGNNEPGYVSKARQEAIDTDAVNSFKKISIIKTGVGIGIICVCDRLITGLMLPLSR